ncbi:MAG: rhodanese-like domain-containing protein, partial [Pseudonocardia sp.]|nr:rhodanese-like domain-containing protein [Pseudonocardia sp.]
ELVPTPLLPAGEIDPDRQRVLDVRQDAELAAGHLPRVGHTELGALRGHTVASSGGPIVTMCGHGERAASAASLLERQGHTDLAIVEGGPDDWARTTGQHLESTS